MWRLVLIATSLIAAGCRANFPESPTQNAAVAGVQLQYTQPHRFIVPGASQSLTLYAIDGDGVFEDVSTRAAWFSSNDGVATVTNGTVRGVSSGVTDISATYQGFRASGMIVVSSFQPSPLVITPARDHRIGVTSPIGLSLGSTSVAGAATFTSSDPRVFTVQGSSVVGAGVGTAAITASYNGFFVTYYASVAPLRAFP